MNKQKKGIQMHEAFGAVLTLVLVATLVIVAIVLFTNLGTSVGTQTGTVANETGSAKSTGYTLANSSLCNFGNLVIQQVYNNSAVALPAANYTMIGSTIYNGTDLNYLVTNISYSYTWGGPACTASRTMITTFSGYPTLVGLIGTIIFLGLVIGILVASFVFGKKENA